MSLLAARRRERCAEYRADRCLNRLGMEQTGLSVRDDHGVGPRGARGPNDRAEVSRPLDRVRDDHER